jgi:U3 small nucleolar ribonucleoprotein protein IMP3
MRFLKYHEKKLLKKVDFINWKQENNHREVAVMRKYYVQKREDYRKYNYLCGHITEIVAKLKTLKQNNPIRIQLTQTLLNKLLVFRW